MDGFELGIAHEKLHERVCELEAQNEERRVADALLLERITVLESKSHHHSEPEPEPEPEEEEEEEEETEEQEEEVTEEEPEPEPEPVAEVPPERKHLLHRVVWG
jgi:cell division protein FtsN